MPFQQRWTPLGLPWTLWLNQLDPHWCMLRITVGKPNGEGYDPWKLGFVDGKFQDSGAQGYENTMFATCENSEHVPVTATLRSHLNFFLPEDILRSFNFWTPRVSDGMHCMVGNNDVLQCKICTCKMLRFSEAGAAVVSNYLRYLSIFAYWFIFLFCLVFKAPNLYILQYFIFWNLWQGSCVPQNLFPFNIDSRSATAEAWIHLTLPWEGTGTWYGPSCYESVSWRGLINIIIIMLELRTMLGVLHVGVSKNNGTPKSSILIGFSIINHPFWGTPIVGNTHVDWQDSFRNIRDTFCMPRHSSLFCQEILAS